MLYLFNIFYQLLTLCHPNPNQEKNAKAVTTFALTSSSEYLGLLQISNKLYFLSGPVVPLYLILFYILVFLYCGIVLLFYVV